MRGIHQEHPEFWLDGLRQADIVLATLAVVRRAEAAIPELCNHLSSFTADAIHVDESRMALEIRRLQSQGYVEQNGDRYLITTEGKRYMFLLLKQWNRYVDTMDNLWGCYYGP